MDPLYQEHILEHYKHPHNHGRMEDATEVLRGENVTCGDDLTLYCKWDGDVLREVAFTGFGCAISQSGASMLTDEIKGKTRQEISRLTHQDMFHLYGITISAQREKCALLALRTLHRDL